MRALERRLDGEVSADALAHPRASDGINDGLGTLQFQSLSVSPHNVKILQGGTQDNGTWEGKNYQKEWRNTMIGDGGQSGFDVAIHRSASTTSPARRRT